MILLGVPIRGREERVGENASEGYYFTYADGAAVVGENRTGDSGGGGGEKRKIRRGRIYRSRR
jgi:hypothetical protein